MGGSHPTTGVKRPVVVVVGGGYGGSKVAKILDKSGKFYVVLIDRKNYFLHNVATLRAVTEPNYANDVLIPYDKLLIHGIVVHAEVTQVTPAAVYVHGREAPIQFDYLVLATGTSYAFPSKIAEPNQRLALAKYNETYDAIAKATNQKVVIIGAGAVGVELAGEIATDFPNKQVTLIHSQKVLANSALKPEFQQKVIQQLVEKKVQLVLEERAILDEVLAPRQNISYVEGQTTVRTDKNATGYPADLVFFATGAQSNNQSLQQHFADKLEEKTGRIRVNPQFQVEGYTNIFALGDIANIAYRQAFIAGLQAPVVADNIQALHDGKPNLKSWTSAPNAMLLSIGRNGGVAQLPFGGGAVFGARISRAIKSQSLFVASTWGDLNANYKKRKGGNTALEQQVDVDPKKLASLVDAMSLNEEEAAKLLKGLPAIEERKAETS